MGKVRNQNTKIARSAGQMVKRYHNLITHIPTKLGLRRFLINRFSVSGRTDRWTHTDTRTHTHTDAAKISTSSARLARR